MIFLTSYIRDLNIYHHYWGDVREPTLHLCGEYLASDLWLGLTCALRQETNCIFL
jgi:hypothetical protein